MNWKRAYTVGFHPWEDAKDDPRFVNKISELFDREEKSRAPHLGQALDLGTGSGIWGIEMAKRGWKVTGVDMVEKALQRAKKRAEKANVNMNLVHGDVTALRAAGINSMFRLVLDTGTFHDLNNQQRRAMGQEIDAVTSDDASIYLLVWSKRRRPLIRGASQSEIETAFPGWKIESTEPSFYKPPKILDLLLKPDEHWYCLRRKKSTQV